MTMAMSYKPIAVVAAMRSELAPLLRNTHPLRVEGIELFELNEAVIAVGGIGTKFAHRAAEVVVKYTRPNLLLSAGSAGAVSQRLKVGDVCQIREVVDVATEMRYFTTGGDWVLATAEGVSDIGGKHELRTKFGADVVDMEASAVAQVAKGRGLEFACLKSIFDDAEFTMPPLGRFINARGRFATGRFLIYTALHPRWWGDLPKLKKNSEIAAGNLCGAVAHLTQQYCSSTGNALSR